MRSSLCSSCSFREYSSVTSRTLVTTMTMLLSESKTGVLVMMARLPVLNCCSIVTDSRRSSASNVPEAEMTRLATSSAMLRPTISSLRRPLMVS